MASVVSVTFACGADFKLASAALSASAGDILASFGHSDSGVPGAGRIEHGGSAAEAMTAISRIAMGMTHFIMASMPRGPRCGERGRADRAARSLGACLRAVAGSCSSEELCRFVGLLLHLVAAGNPFAGDHVFVSHAGAAHRIEVSRRINHA